MRITRHDNCDYCHKRFVMVKDFFRPVDMFNPGCNTITKEMKAEIIAWRDEPKYCDDHAYIKAENLLLQAQA